MPVRTAPGEPPPASWYRGSPFRRLEVFEFEHAPIFFGRTQAIGAVCDALKRQAAFHRAFVLVLGMSGCGKSSLVRAGVLPVLTQPGIVEGVDLWRRCVFRPGYSESDPLEALARALLAADALPELEAMNFPAPVLAEHLRRARTAPTDRCAWRWLAPPSRNRRAIASPVVPRRGWPSSSTSSRRSLPARIDPPRTARSFSPRWRRWRERRRVDHRHDAERLLLPLCRAARAGRAQGGIRAVRPAAADLRRNRSDDPSPRVRRGAGIRGRSRVRPAARRGAARGRFQEPRGAAAARVHARRALRPPDRRGPAHLVGLPRTGGT